ncbi:hypothetical protein AB0E25_25535 [Streptomyces bobili]|uniref:hypothetical protein n=1 Tax=Streptomyces bobili TaxID=67280 RepID=UPI0033F2C313
MRSTPVATALAVLFSSAALSVVPAGTASAAATTVTNTGGLVVDGALQRVEVPVLQQLTRAPTRN